MLALCLETSDTKAFRLLTVLRVECEKYVRVRNEAAVSAMVDGSAMALTPAKENNDA